MFKTIRVGTGTPSLTITGVFADKKIPSGAGRLSKSARAAIDKAIATPGFTAKPGEIAGEGDRQLVVGLGKADELELDTLRTIGARLVKRLDRMKVNAAALRIAEVIDSSPRETVGQCLGEGMGLANWRVDFFDGTAAETAAANPGLRIVVGDAKCRSGLKRGLALAESTNYARRIAATPPNICNPKWMVTEARRLARQTGLRCRVIDYKQAQAMKMGGIVNVGRASSNKPCLIILEHKPTRIAAAARGVKVALVGKTITFDTGGYSLKPPAGMAGMKYDKCGGMAVLGAMRALADLKVPVHVVGLLPAAENMVGGDAYRPDDIIEMHNGVTVEVTNTDAEGRLVLGDALAYACAKLKPTVIVDAATLTGGVVVALGSWCAGLWCGDSQLQQRVQTAADQSGERVWPMPLWKDHRDFMRSKHADIWNSGPKRDGHPIQGAAFLSYFVDPKIPWAHLDIAGTATVDGDQDLYVKGPTGFGVRLLTELVEGYGRKKASKR